MKVTEDLGTVRFQAEERRPPVSNENHPESRSGVTAMSQQLAENSIVGNRHRRAGAGNGTTSRLYQSKDSEGNGDEPGSSNTQLERLYERCHRLRLYQIEHELTSHLEQAAKKELSYADFLDELLAAEVSAKIPNRTRSISQSRVLPVVKEALTLRQVASYLRVHKNTVYRLVTDRQLPAFKVGHSWRFDSERIDRWLIEQEQAARSTPNLDD